MKRLAVRLTLLSLVGIVWAQEGVKFGLRASPGVGIFSLDSVGRTIRGLKGGGKFSFSGGLMLSFGFSDNVALLLGAGVGTAPVRVDFSPNYAIRGTYNSRDTLLPLDQAGLASTQSVTFGLTTVNVPVFIKLRTNPLGPTPLRAKGVLGGQVDVRVGATTRSDKVIVSADFIDQDKARITDQHHISPFLAQASAGAGVDIDLEGIGVIDITFLYNHGLVNFLNKDFKFNATVGGVEYKDLKPYKDLKGRLSSLQLQLMFWF